MRRKDREITGKEEILDIMKRCDVCNIAFFDAEFPYVIPLNFGVEYKDETFVMYFHCALEGKKLELLKLNSKVAFSMSCSHNLVVGEQACNCTMEFESVCGNGELELLPDEDKISAFTCLMNHYQPKKEYTFNEKHLKAVVLLKLTVNEISGKRLKK
ncbi:pyridoxamine 5'-phosphate oxidase family protein [Anaerosporobacter sp.]|uniref:pyridoxamine 5'-phosphate oxidase family protein n=1 Tax=Anaerosporobacter sp. TaxID=1872529 RepID=UPI00286ED733|nr:pyridoxamine 5'-phosphate oxidase family protein [Anaerosporobacter sp.]